MKSAHAGGWVGTIGVRQGLHGEKQRHSAFAPLTATSLGAAAAAAAAGADADAGGLLQGLNEDSITVQNAISEKLGNVIHHA